MHTTLASALHIRTLDPFDFLERSAAIFREKVAVIDGDARRTYPEWLEATYAVPLARGILCTPSSAPGSRAAKASR